MIDDAMNEHKHVWTGSPTKGRKCKHCGKPQPQYTLEESEALVDYFRRHDERINSDSND